MDVDIALALTLPQTRLRLFRVPSDSTRSARPTTPLLDSIFGFCLVHRRPPYIVWCVRAAPLTASNCHRTHATPVGPATPLELHRRQFPPCPSNQTTYAQKTALVQPSLPHTVLSSGRRRGAALASNLCRKLALLRTKLALLCSKIGFAPFKIGFAPHKKRYGIRITNRGQPPQFPKIYRPHHPRG